MKQVISKSGRLLKGREYEWYTGDCPPERPCDPEKVEWFRAQFDAQPGEARQQCRNAHPERCLHHGPTVRDPVTGKAKTVPP